MPGEGGNRRIREQGAAHSPTASRDASRTREALAATSAAAAITSCLVVNRLSPKRSEHAACSAGTPNAQPVHRLDGGPSWSVPRERRDAPTMSAAGTEPWESTSYIRENNIGVLATTSPNASMSESLGRHGAGSAQVRGVSEVTAAEKPRASIATAIRPA